MSRRIYVVEDAAAIRELLKNVLEESGFDVRAYADALSAFAAVREAPPDLLIIDVFLGIQPRGIDLVRTLRGDARTIELPVIVISAEGQVLRQQRRVLRDLGCWTLEKPFEFDVLLSLIGSILDSPGSANHGDTPAPAVE